MTAPDDRARPSARRWSAATCWSLGGGVQHWLSPVGRAERSRAAAPASRRSVLGMLTLRGSSPSASARRCLVFGAGTVPRRRQPVRRPAAVTVAGPRATSTPTPSTSGAHAPGPVAHRGRWSTSTTAGSTAPSTAPRPLLGGGRAGAPAHADRVRALLRADDAGRLARAVVAALLAVTVPVSAHLLTPRRAARSLVPLVGARRSRFVGCRRPQARAGQADRPRRLARRRWSTSPSCSGDRSTPARADFQFNGSWRLDQGVRRRTSRSASTASRSCWSRWSAVLVPIVIARVLELASTPATGAEETGRSPDGQRRGLLRRADPAAQSSSWSASSPRPTSSCSTSSSRRCSSRCTSSSGSFGGAAPAVRRDEVLPVLARRRPADARPSVIGIYVASGTRLGQASFDLATLQRLAAQLPHSVQVPLFLGFFIAFAIKAPLVPLHTWLPDAGAEAPIGGGVILVGVLDKVGVFGFLRYCLPLFPLASQSLAPLVLVLSVIGVIYGALLAAMADRHEALRLLHLDRPLRVHRAGDLRVLAAGARRVRALHGQPRHLDRDALPRRRHARRPRRVGPDRRLRRRRAHRAGALRAVPRRRSDHAVAAGHELVRLGVPRAARARGRASRSTR